MTGGAEVPRGRGSAVAFLLAVASLAACAHRAAQPPVPAARAAISTAPSLAGRWQGVLRAPASPPSGFVLVLDSSAGVWRGSLTLAQAGPDPIALASVVRTADSVVLTLPASAQGAVLRGRLAPDGALAGDVVAGGARFPFAAAREGTAGAAALQAEGDRVAASRRLAPSGDSVPAAAPQPDPNAARLVTSDIALFWRAVDAAPPDSLAAYLQRDYLDKGSVGVRDFVRGRILSAEDLAASVRARRARYDSARAGGARIAEADSAIRVAFRRLKALYPAAVFPDVYFVVGRFNSGGTSSKHGLLIGSEMYQDPARLPPIVSHELIHFQQHYPSRSLIAHSFMEGTADFIGEMIAGAQINNDAHRYGLAHEHELWVEFQPRMDDSTYYPWMYGRPADGRPNDLGYFIGYRIAKAYYDRAADKPRAIREIIAGNGGDVKAILAKSGYAP